MDFFKDFVKDNYQVFKWVVLLGSAPIWLPFMKIIWAEFRRTLAPDGGLLGRETSEEDAAAMRLELEQEHPSLISEPLAHYRARMQGRNPGQSAQSARRRKAPMRQGPPRRTFRARR